MVDMLGFIDGILTKIDIPYEFGEWTSTVTYPYFVGTFNETDYRFEDNCTTGIFTLEGWSRESKISLIKAVDAIKKAFQNTQAVQNDEIAFFVRYGNALTVPTGEADLYKITITLFTYEWKGE